MSNKKDNLTNLYILLGVVILIWFFSIYFLNSYDSDMNNKALIGDSFGVINSLFSGLAFAGVIYTILLQRKELSLQREELRQTREELKRSANAQEKSERELKRQSENLKITAKLNAMNTLVSYYANIESSTRNYGGVKNREAVEQQSLYIRKIKDILDKKENY